MKLNIEVEVDWIGEEGSIDDTIKKEITDRVVNTVCEKVEKEMQDKAASAISDKVDAMCNSLIDEFMKKKVTVTDKWGEAIIVDTTIEAILKQKFDEFWNATVDESGRSGRSGYGSQKPRFEWAVDRHIEEHAKNFAKTLTNDTANKIKENMTKALQEKIGQKLVQDLGFDKLLLQEAIKS
jgi:hypothetical protein